MNLPSSNSQFEYRNIWYALGFNPMYNVYKLLKLCHNDEYKLFYDVLTLETSSISQGEWKGEKYIPSYNNYTFIDVGGQSYYVNGMNFWKFVYERSGECIISFDVHHENVKIIKPPPIAPTRRFGQFEGKLALSYTHKDDYDSWILDLWVLEDDQNIKWTKVSIKLSSEVDKYFYEATPIGNFPSGELVLSCFECQKVDNYLYIYDAMKSKFTRLMIDLPRSLALACRTGYPAHISCLFENMFSLDTSLDDVVEVNNN
ncbi:hypothetical protein R3W88_019086 [Solanum pinnatisectum]|uniref:F-box associated beta-propeller type 3 domain-containing protein n=1 Tax=Solanum pinnatisectum TaxID=50273 RepID=A0AAV9KKV2_9SOLN|nr:hypothetical protein R3W88_019086 [Solanum pinnatisectum]